MHTTTNPRRRHVGTGAVAAAALAMAAVATAVVPAGASDDRSNDHRRGTRTVVADVTQPASTTEPACLPDGSQCVAFRAATTTLTGGLAGTATGRVGTWAALENGVPVRSSLEGVQLFVGTVEGCGTGSFAWTLRGETTATPPFETQLRIIPGSGTGELANISGRGQASLVGPPPLRGTITFRMRCG